MMHTNANSCTQLYKRKTTSLKACTAKYAWHCLCHPCSPQTEWVMILRQQHFCIINILQGWEARLAGRAQINTLVLSGSTLQSCHNIEPPPPPPIHTHAPPPPPAAARTLEFLSCPVLWKQDCSSTLGSALWSFQFMDWLNKNVISPQLFTERSHECGQSRS